MKKRLIKIIISALLYIIALFIKQIWIKDTIFILSYLIVGYSILRKALRNIFRGKVFDENFLMAVATLGAFAIKEFPEAVAVMLFYQVGELFQSYAVDKSRKSIAGLMDIRPDYANLIKNGKEEKIEPEEVNINDIIIVKPGEKIPLDGIVLEGSSLIDTKALTGESVPREVAVGENVLSGSINQNGVLKIRVTKNYSESTVSKILDLVENASSKKSKSENFITKFARYYTPTVVIIAVILAIVPPFFIKNVAFSDWLYRALSFLVVSCPCALVISIPLSFFGGIGGASKLGILIKGSNYLEAVSKTEIAVFDKTGTLTEGVFEVQKIDAINIDENELLEIVSHAENFSSHPIAKSIKNSYKKQIDEKRVEDVKELSGNGIMATVDGKKVLVGNENLMTQNNIEYKKCDETGTVLYVAIDNKYVGFILIADKIKDDSYKMINLLKTKGIKNIIMLTGDKKDVGESVSRKLGIDKVYSELLPHQKVNKMEELLKNKTENGKLIFVGDGINDSPVLAMSDIGIAMGALGSDSAIEAADIVIMTDEISKLSDLIDLSKKTMRIVRENIIFAICIKVIVLVLCAVGLSNMWEAVFADVGVSIIAIINALRMLNVKRKA